MENEVIDALPPCLLNIVLEYAEPRVDQYFCDKVFSFYNVFGDGDLTTYEEKEEWFFNTFRNWDPNHPFTLEWREDDWLVQTPAELREDYWTTYKYG